MNGSIRFTFASIAGLLFLSTTCVIAHAQDGQLILHVTPREAYIFVDGRAVGEANKHHTLKLSAGGHKVELVNYGYAPDRRDVTIKLDDFEAATSIKFEAMISAHVRFSGSLSLICDQSIA